MASCYSIAWIEHILLIDSWLAELWVISSSRLWWIILPWTFICKYVLPVYLVLTGWETSQFCAQSFNVASVCLNINPVSITQLADIFLTPHGLPLTQDSQHYFLVSLSFLHACSWYPSRPKIHRKVWIPCQALLLHPSTCLFSCQNPAVV